MDTLKLQVSKLDNKAYVNLRRHKKNLVFHKLVHFFRIIEICLISVFIWRNGISEKLSTEYLHEFLMFLSSPKTVFLIGNAIVVILLAESRLRQNMSSDGVMKQKKTDDVYDEYIQIKDGDGDHQVKSYSRSKSDTGRKKEKVEELSRSGTVGGVDSCKQLTVVEEEAVFGKKRMSDDEFRDMVEAFIARQQRNLRKES